MIQLSSEEWLLWLNTFLWVLIRMIGLMTTAPVFGHRAIPPRIKMCLAIAITFLIAPTLPPSPTVNPSSISGIMILAEQFIIGAAMGLMVQIVFASVTLAGEVASMTMGLGFAAFFDATTQGTTPVLSQFLLLITTVIFLSLNLHLVLLEVLANSFTLLPIGQTAAVQTTITKHVFQAGAIIFSSGIQLALPILTALLISNIALGILTRSAPQLNLFGIGFPITLAIGLGMFWVMLSHWGAPLQHLVEWATQLPQEGLIQIQGQ